MLPLSLLWILHYRNSQYVILRYEVKAYSVCKWNLHTGFSWFSWCLTWRARGLGLCDCDIPWRGQTEVVNYLTGTEAQLNMTTGAWAAVIGPSGCWPSFHPGNSIKCVVFPILCLSNLLFNSLSFWWFWFKILLLVFW